MIYEKTDLDENGSSCAVGRVPLEVRRLDCCGCVEGRVEEGYFREIRRREQDLTRGWYGIETYEIERNVATHST